MASPFKAAPLSFSKLDCFVTCGTKFLFKYLQKLPDPNGIPADVGDGFHAIADKASRWADELEISKLLEEKAILLGEEAATDLRDVVHRYLDRNGGLPPIPADAQDIEHEAELAIRADGSACDYWAPDALFRGRLDLSWTESGGAIAVVRDWKTARVIGEVGTQLKLYGLLLAAKFPAVEQVVAELHFVRYSAVRKEVFDADELRTTLPESLAAAARTIDEAAENRKLLKAKPSRGCFFCPYRLQCPEMKRHKPGLEVATPQQAMEVAAEVLRLQVALQEAEAALREWTMRNGPVQLESGESVGHHPSTERAVANVPGAVAALQEMGVDPQFLRDAITIRLTDIEKAIKTLPEYSGARRGGKQELLDKRLAELREAGIITTTTTTKFGRRSNTEEA